MGRTALAKYLRAKQATYVEISKVLGISPQRVRQLVLRADHEPPEWTRGLSTQTAKILVGNGFSGKTNVHNFIECGGSIHRLKEKRLAEIKSWLEI